MAQQLILEFSGVTEEQYWAVNTALGIDVTQTQNWPEGMTAHFAGTTEDGSLVVTEIWESQEAQHAFMDSRLGPALGQVQVPPPARMLWLDLVSDVRL